METKLLIDNEYDESKCGTKSRRLLKHENSPIHFEHPVATQLYYMLSKDLMEILPHICKNQEKLNFNDCADRFSKKFAAIIYNLDIDLITNEKLIKNSWREKLQSYNNECAMLSDINNNKLKSANDINRNRPKIEKSVKELYKLSFRNIDNLYKKYIQNCSTNSNSSIDNVGISIPSDNTLNPQLHIIRNCQSKVENIKCQFHKINKLMDLHLLSMNYVKNSVQAFFKFSELMQNTPNAHYSKIVELNRARLIHFSTITNLCETTNYYMPKFVYPQSIQEITHNIMETSLHSFDKYMERKINIIFNSMHKNENKITKIQSKLFAIKCTIQHKIAKCKTNCSRRKVNSYFTQHDTTKRKTDWTSTGSNTTREIMPPTNIENTVISSLIKGISSLNLRAIFMQDDITLRLHKMAGRCTAIFTQLIKFKKQVPHHPSPYINQSITVQKHQIHNSTKQIILERIKAIDMTLSKYNKNYPIIQKIRTYSKVVNVHSISLIIKQNLQLSISSNTFTEDTIQFHSKQHSNTYKVLHSYILSYLNKFIDQKYVSKRFGEYLMPLLKSYKSQHNTQIAMSFIQSLLAIMYSCIHTLSDEFIGLKISTYDTIKQMNLLCTKSINRMQNYFEEQIRMTELNNKEFLQKVHIKTNRLIEKYKPISDVAHDLCLELKDIPSLIISAHKIETDRLVKGFKYADISPINRLPITFVDNQTQDCVVAYNKRKQKLKLTNKLK